MKLKNILLLSSLTLVLGACNTPQRVEQYAMTLSPLDLCDKYVISSSSGDKTMTAEYTKVINQRNVDCSKYQEALDIRANTRFLATVIGG